jgi:hypothetical protein
MRRPGSLLLAALVGGAAPLAGQGGVRGLVRGGVVSAESGDRIPHALVALPPRFGGRFAGEDGVFAFLDVAPGPVRLEVRQVGYQPWDSTLDVGDEAVVVRVEMRRVTVRLAAITIAGDAACDSPGPPDAAREPGLSALFTDLHLNAERHRLLADEYRYRYRIERRITLELSDGSSATRLLDTLERRSEDRWRYRPGRVVTRPRGRAPLVHLPELADLADPVFVANHCFRFAGMDSLGGGGLVRVDFSPAAALTTPDIGGSAWLDSAGHQLRRLEVRVTNPGLVHAEIDALSAVVVFDEALSGLSLPRHLIGFTTWLVSPASRLVGQVEEQRRLSLTLQRPPGSQP